MQIAAAPHTRRLPLEGIDQLLLFGSNDSHLKRIESLTGTRIYDRRTRTITEIDQAMVIQFAGGKLRAGPFYAQWLLEPGTWRRIATLPAKNSSQYRWSQDNHYVAAGTILGKGGPCI